MLVSLAALWMPILVASVLVFVAGYVLNMILPHHRTDFERLPDEDAVIAALRAQNLGEGDYVFPYASTAEDLKDKAYQTKAQAGPNGLLIMGPSVAGPTGAQLGGHFVYILVISVIVAYIGGAVLPAGVDYLKVFQVVGVSAWLAYAGAAFVNSIWWHVKWSSTLKTVCDGLVYALLTAGTFGWLWPGV